MQWITFVLTSTVGLFSWTVISLITNLVAARRIGLPLIISPASPLNPFWILAYRAFPAVLLVRYLPFGLGRWARCTVIGWTFQDKRALHDELGPVFVIVTPGGNQVTVADSKASHEIFSRRKDFTKPAVMYEPLNVFGRNLNTVEGKDWERQRRLTAPSFNEKVSESVWEESLRQVKGMESSWVGEGAEGTREVISDTATLALHVLTAVGFGLSYPFHGGVRDLQASHSMTYKDALLTCLHNIVTFTIVPRKALSLSFLPRKLRELGIAVREFQQYMDEMLAHERDLDTSRAPNLMGSLVRASEDLKTINDGTVTHLSLSSEEIFGNIFAFNLAGHETTANTLATSIVLLAAHPKYQHWLREELQSILGSSESWAYTETFPQLHRCLAVMYETLRLYGSIVFIPKTTTTQPQLLQLSNDQTCLIPPNTAVNINVQALHTDPAVWGPDALEWKPDRWLQASQTETHDVPSEQRAPHFVPPDGSYVPWAAGPRACVGKKFSQVEFVAVLAALFRGRGVRPVREGGESEEEARAACTGMVEDSGIQYITLQMRRPRARALEWVGI